MFSQYKGGGGGLRVPVLRGGGGNFPIFQPPTLLVINDPSLSGHSWFHCQGPGSVVSMSTSRWRGCWRGGGGVPGQP